jgi:hypothetical protein
VKIINITKTYKTKPIKVLIPVIDIILLLAFDSAFLVDKETGAIILLIALFVSFISYGVLSTYMFKMMENGPIMRADVIGDFPLDTPAEKGADDNDL